MSEHRSEERARSAADAAMSARAKSNVSVTPIVNWERCKGHGLCAALLPERIALDEWGFPIITPGPADDRDVRRAVAACPALALRLERQPAHSR
jgi:ferredoxin